MLRRRIRWSGGLQGPIWYFLAHLSFLASINVITKTTYHSQSYNSSDAIILVYSSGSLLQLCLFFSLLCFSLLRFSLLTIDCSQPLTRFYFLWIFRSYLLWFFSYLLWFFSYLLWFFCSYLLRLIFFCHFISIFCLYNTLDSQSYNSSDAIILVYSSGSLLQLCLFFSLLCFSLLRFSLLTIDCSQPLTRFYFLWIFRSYLLWFFSYLLWFFCSYLLRLIFFCHFISIFCLYNTLDFLIS